MHRCPDYLADHMIFDGITIARLVDELAGKVDRVERPTQD